MTFLGINSFDEMKGAFSWLGLAAGGEATPKRSRGRAGRES